ncbi:hypothetical protein Tco_0026692, partial [Tanacetum coccineum]
DIIARYSTYKAIKPDLPIEEPDNSLNIGDEHLYTIPETKSDEVIKSSVENLVPILSEFEGISDDTCNVPTCDNDRINVESKLAESLINRDTSIVHSSKIDPILEEFTDKLAHIAPIPPGIVEADFDPNDDTSSDDDDFKDIEYVSLEEVEQEEKEFDLEDIFQVQDVILHEKLLNVHRLISKIESLKDNPTPDHVFKSPSSFPIHAADSDSFLEESDTSLSHLDNSLPEFETFSDHTEETRSGSTTTHANYSLPEYDSFLFEIEPNQEGLISIDNSNNTLLEFLEFESFHFDPSIPRPPPEPPDEYLNFEPILVMKNVVFNEDFYQSKETLPLHVEDVNTFTFIIWTFLPYFTYTEESHSFFSFKNEDTIFDPDIITFHKPVDSTQQFLKDSHVRLIYSVLLELLILCTDTSKNHKKTVKNGQARTRESVEYKAEARKVKPQSKSAKKSQTQKYKARVKSVFPRGSQAHSHEEATSAMVKAQGVWVFALNTLTQLAQAVTSKNDSLAIRVSVLLIQRLKSLIQ